jgi:hypothetical protein
VWPGAADAVSASQTRGTFRGAALARQRHRPRPTRARILMLRSNRRWPLEDLNAGRCRCAPAPRSRFSRRAAPPRPRGPRGTRQRPHAYAAMSYKCSIRWLGVTDVPRRVKLSPRCLTPEQLAADPTVPAEPVPVRAWVIWEDGVEEQVTGQAVAWTPRAVRVRWGVPPHQHETWVWAGAVVRA